MNIFRIKETREVRALSPVRPRTEREMKFNQLWENKKFDEAMSYFPNQWTWFSEDISKELITDMPGCLVNGLVLSKKAFTLVAQEFPGDITRHHPFELDGHLFEWIEVKIINDSDIKSTQLNIFILRPSYKTYVSERFSDFFKENNLTGNALVPEEI